MINIHCKVVHFQEVFIDKAIKIYRLRINYGTKKISSKPKLEYL